MKLSIYHKSSVEYRHHQIEALGKLAPKSSFLLSTPTGGGKTLISLSTIAYSFQFNKITRAIFVVEPKNSEQTGNEVKKYFNNLPVSIFTYKDKKARTRMYEEFLSNPEHKIMIINYELLRNDLNLISKIFHVHKVALVLDEATKFKTRTTQINKIISRFASMSQRTLALTATPIMNKLEDLHIICQTIGINAVSDFTFYNQHCEFTTKHFGKRKVRHINSFKNLEAYYQKISAYSFFKKKSDFIDTSFSYSKVNLQLGDEEKLALNIIKKELKDKNDMKSEGNFIDKDTPKESLSVSRIAIALSSPSLITGNTHIISVKEQDLMDFIDNDLDEKMMVYTPFKTIVDRLEEILNNKYGKDFAVSIHGETKNVEAIKHKIINNPKTKILLGTSSIEKGLDGLQAVVDTEYMFTLPISAGSFLQLLGRTSRDGGLFKNITVVIPFMGKHLMDFDLWILIQNQFRMIQQVAPDTLEQGCIDEDMAEFLPVGNIENGSAWLKSKLNVSYG